MDLEQKAPKIKIPSKTFLTGEYAVLDGGECLVLTHAPFFEAEYNNSCSGPFFHPESPAGRILVESGEQQKFSFKDPHFGSGGFGGSTAELIAAGHFSKTTDLDRELLKRYFSFFTGSKTPPSGADLAAQIRLNPGLLKYQKQPLKFNGLAWPFDEVSICIYKTSYKLKTHEHLETVAERSFEKLKRCSKDVLNALEDADLSSFIEAVDAFSKEQEGLDLLLEETASLVKSLKSICGVITARGCGAMGADVVAVFVKKEASDYLLEQVANQRLNLKFVAKV